MKLTVTFIRYFLVLLWVYASVSKLITFDEFQVQLAQSPLLSAYAVPVSYLVIIAELLIAVLLCVRRSMLAGLYLSFGLMTAFAVYIYLILNYSDFVPCSCGGILEKMGWTEHLWFNIMVCLLILLAIIFTDIFKKRILIASSVLLVLSAGTVIALFLSSEYIIKKENPFVRRFLPHPIKYVDEYDLKLNSYYVIDIYQDSIYLGNATAPLFIGIMPLSMDTLIERSIDLNSQLIQYRTSKVQFYPPYFFMIDGVMPYVYRGKIGEWTGIDQQVKAYFSLAVPVDSASLFIRSRSAKTQENILGKIELFNDSKVYLKDSLLEKQIDGVFDTDGTLLYNKELDRLIYTYFYRNQFLVLQPNLEMDFKGSTIDTISKAQIKVGDYNRDGRRKMIQPPLTTNKNTATYGQWLFVHSGLKGKNEPSDVWNRASVLDVYDLDKHIYSFSIYVPNRNKDKMSQFAINKNHLIAVFNQHIQLYQLNPRWFGNENKTIDQ